MARHAEGRIRIRRSCSLLDRPIARLTILVVGVAIVVGVLGWQQSRRPPDPRQSISRDAKLAGLDLSPYDATNWPDLFRTLGPDVILGRLQKLREDGARTATTILECEKVISSDYSPSRSTALRLVVYVDCLPQTRVYYSEDGDVEAERLPFPLSP